MDHLRSDSEDDDDDDTPADDTSGRRLANFTDSIAFSDEPQVHCYHSVLMMCSYLCFSPFITLPLSYAMVSDF